MTSTRTRSHDNGHYYQGDDIPEGGRRHGQSGRVLGHLHLQVGKQSCIGGTNGGGAIVFEAVWPESSDRRGDRQSSFLEGRRKAIEKLSKKSDCQSVFYLLNVNHDGSTCGQFLRI